MGSCLVGSPSFAIGMALLPRNKLGQCLLNASIMLAACSRCGAPALGSAALRCAQQPSRISGYSLGVGDRGGWLCKGEAMYRAVKCGTLFSDPFRFGSVPLNNKVYLNRTLQFKQT